VSALIKVNTATEQLDIKLEGPTHTQSCVSTGKAAGNDTLYGLLIIKYIRYSSI